MRRGLRALASSLWPLGLALQVSVVGGAGWSEPDSTSRAMGATTVAFLVALLGLEQVLPSRREWSIRGDREVWRGLGLAVLYTTLGGSVAQLTFLFGMPAALSRLGFAGGLRVWPAESPLLFQIVAVVVLGDFLGTGTIASPTRSPGSGPRTRFITRRFD